MRPRIHPVSHRALMAATRLVAAGDVAPMHVTIDNARRPIEKMGRDPVVIFSTGASWIPAATCDRRFMIWPVVRQPLGTGMGKGRITPQLLRLFGANAVRTTPAG